MKRKKKFNKGIGVKNSLRFKQINGKTVGQYGRGFTAFFNEKLKKRDLESTIECKYVNY